MRGDLRKICCNSNVGYAKLENNHHCVSVIMSTYNGEKFLEEQLESIFNQTVPVNVYVRDDASTDSTRAILNKYQKS